MSLLFAATLLERVPSIGIAQTEGTREAQLSGSAKLQILSALDFISFRTHPRQKLLKVFAFREYPVNGLTQTLLEADSVLHRRRLAGFLGVRARIFNDGKSVGAAYLVVHPAQNHRGVLHVLELPVAVQIDAVKLNVIVNMRFVDMRGDYELVPSPCEFHRKLIAYPVRLLRRDLSGFERLDNPVHNDVPLFWLAPSRNPVIKPFADFKLLGGCLRRTHIRGNQFPVLGLFRLLVVFVPLVHGREARPVFHGLAREKI